MFWEISDFPVNNNYYYLLVIFDIDRFLFLAFWAFLYFVGFCYLWNQWGKSTAPSDGVGINNVQAAIAFSFFSIFSWVRILIPLFNNKTKFKLFSSSILSIFFVLRRCPKTYITSSGLKNIKL